MQIRTPHHKEKNGKPYRSVMIFFTSLFSLPRVILTLLNLPIPFPPTTTAFSVDFLIQYFSSLETPNCPTSISRKSYIIITKKEISTPWLTYTPLPRARARARNITQPQTSLSNSKIKKVPIQCP
ncbi:hypothetical protein DM02DRAFT_279485 [Periconia macrospinosa]|uniref:Uncharacterized protein n=1 Tax=Periconia macrospinosa TaxID=97972 RepID=A0A2V1DWU6_9PLEO|nr:hypothetical protein DM02DRAFT_279485 [Periconia macrospinosa]